MRSGLRCAVSIAELQNTPVTTFSTAIEHRDRLQWCHHLAPTDAAGDGLEERKH
eukprot:CAMPEP_0180688140 /NCGR_PEP_ID=MMETSP1037_2-20121125/73820_1 /TAXON_ID=632150 /ORGANISM="Azadinium spinosum, Strain 3D9" /LENGTH=53 /DNA_ID=CAMNT_0022718957 /DNA_START=205 /DNA_END=366 /DNA_ORIENTATION=+